MAIAIAIRNYGSFLYNVTLYSIDKDTIKKIDFVKTNKI